MPDDIDNMITIIQGARKLRFYFKEQLLDVPLCLRYTTAMYFREIERNDKVIYKIYVQLSKELSNESKQYRQKTIRQEMALYQGKGS